MVQDKKEVLVMNRKENTKTKTISIKTELVAKNNQKTRLGHYLVRNM